MFYYTVLIDLLQMCPLCPPPPHTHPLTKDPASTPAYGFSEIKDLKII
jgi:hypothetical protein